jgi:hypothetical protein
MPGSSSSGRVGARGPLSLRNRAMELAADGVNGKPGTGRLNERSGSETGSA